MQKNTLTVKNIRKKYAQREVVGGVSLVRLRVFILLVD